jgi:hypothetical protein
MVGWSAWTAFVSALSCAAAEPKEEEGVRNSIELPDWCLTLRMSHSRAVSLLTRVERLHESKAYVSINILAIIPRVAR